MDIKDINRSETIRQVQQTYQRQAHYFTTTGQISPKPCISFFRAMKTIRMLISKKTIHQHEKLKKTLHRCTLTHHRNQPSSNIQHILTKIMKIILDSSQFHIGQQSTWL
ncbi:hypothetical protein Tsp_05555 [Trichinella spiralis]|uniref:hypothetical protein n=1 Tax=Trichinella spiralis TaxID=6334 RepID=UPI0001EFDDD3|nr:hypothetical protein Tsp_05555 [Trichinella spiralis]